MKAMTVSMCELESVLRAHAQRYPKMEPTDAVKLLYQNEFGGGHLVRDELACLQYLRREYACVVRDPKADASESIGNGLVRVHLAALSPEEAEQLGQRFLRSAAAHQGTLASFLEKLQLLRQLTLQGIFGFCAEQLEEYLTSYKAAGYPMVSHSQTYRDAYHPAYRVVRVDCP